MSSERIDWATVPMVFTVRTACPECGCFGYKRSRTDSFSDHTVQKKVVCKRCSPPYKIVAEVSEPESQSCPFRANSDFGSL